MTTDNLLSPKTDFRESPVDNPDFILFTDSLYLQGPHGKYQAGYAAVSPMSILENGHLPNVSPARQAELIALTRACQLQKENLSLSTKDSHYAFGVAYGFCILWKQRGFLTSSGQPIKNGKPAAEFEMQFRYQVCWILLRYQAIQGPTLPRQKETSD